MFQALSDPYFKNLAKVEREPSAQPVTKMEFEFERRRITKEDVRELIYREILEYHPNMLKEFLDGAEPTGFMYPRYSVFRTHYLFYFQLGFVRLVHINIGLSYVVETLLVLLLSDALVLEVVLSASTGKVLRVGLHFIVGTILE